MRLSPFEPPVDDSWLPGVDLYGGRIEPPQPHDPFTFEVIPVPSGADPPFDWYQRIPREMDEYEEQPIEFNIPDANTSEDYVQMITAGEQPRLRWYSRSQFKTRFQYDPLNPPRPTGVDPDHWKTQAKTRLKSKPDPTVTLNDDRRTLLQRIARLWNGEVVCGVHLLADHCPRITELTTDLNEDTLNRLYYNTDLGKHVILAFNDADWFNRPNAFLKPNTLLRKQAWYDLGQKGRTLINGRNDLPNLHGDPHEGLVHRVTTGLVRLHDELRDWHSTSYRPWQDYVIDVLGTDQDGQVYAREVMTEHHNWKLYRKTYWKLKTLNEHDVKPVAVFDSRETAYTVFNHWLRAGIAELPNGTFDSDFNISDGQEETEDAYENDAYDWPVADWTTTWKLKEKTLESTDPALTRNQIVSLDW